ncbi:MAG: DUF5115 domain-containing protein, partial [Prevotella sp.]|nr:DUF5115 domain-containing protein [Prevotella sp.]
MLKKFLYGLTLIAVMASCSDDYTDWASPQTNPEEKAKTVEMSVGAVPDIDLGEIVADSVQLFVPTVVASDEAVSSFTVELFQPPYVQGQSKSVVLTTDAQGYVSVEDLQAAVVELFGARPEKRQVGMVVTCLTSVGGQSIKNVASGAGVNVMPAAPLIETAYYLTGSINGWNNNDNTYKLTNDGSDPYTNPTFTLRIPAPEDGSNVEFKMTPESGLGGDWSGCLAGGEEQGTFVYNNAGGNLVIEAIPGAKYYDLTFNMLDLTWSYTAISFEPFVYFIGATDGWANAEQKLALVNDEGLYTGYIYCADPNGWGNEFKFQRVAGSWDNEINYNTFTSVTGFEKGDGSNIKAAAGEGVYYVTLDLSNNTLNGIKVNNMNLVGDFNGWNPGDDAQQMTWDAANYCYVITNAGVTSNGWKFT